jgi:uncharacterized repeat protein (TIGR03803 family)
MNRNTLVGLSLVAIVALLASSAYAQTFSVIHTFIDSLDGKNPQAGLTIRGGNLFGTTYLNLFDPVFEMQRSGSSWTLTPLVNSSASSTARVRFGPDGHLYSTATRDGGKAGSVFSAIPPVTVCKLANCGWKQNVVHAFQNIPDGAIPGYGDVIWDQQGNMYGTTMQGGQNNGGTVWELTPSGNSWTESILYNFTGTDTGYFPYAGVVLDSNGTLLGTTFVGGSGPNGGVGIVYQLKYAVGVGWQETIIHNFQDADDGGYPVAGLVADGAGNFYGATTDGGSDSGGTIYELSPAGDSYAFSVVYSLSGVRGPYADLSLDDAGNLYGTTVADGAHNEGSVFKLTKTVNGWVYTSLYDFTGGPDGAQPISNVSIDTDGTLYGTASVGGSSECNGGCGTVWMIKP